MGVQVSDKLEDVEVEVDVVVFLRLVSWAAEALVRLMIPVGGSSPVSARWCL